MTIGATVQRVLRREPLSEEPQTPGGCRLGIRHSRRKQGEERSRRPEQLLRYVSD